MNRVLYQWAEDHGYQSYRCPHCGQTFWTDSDPRGECCQASDEDEETCSDEDDETASVQEEDECPF